MEYILSEQDIKNIIKEGKFDKKKYLDNAAIQYSYISDGLNAAIYNLDRDEEDRFKRHLGIADNKEKIYEEISDSFYISDHAWENLDYCLDEQYEEYLEKWLRIYY